MVHEVFCCEGYIFNAVRWMRTLTYSPYILILLCFFTISLNVNGVSSGLFVNALLIRQAYNDHCVLNHQQSQAQYSTLQRKISVCVHSYLPIN